MLKKKLSWLNWTTNSKLAMQTVTTMAIRPGRSTTPRIVFTSDRRFGDFEKAERLFAAALQSANAVHWNFRKWVFRTSCLKGRWGLGWVCPITNWQLRPIYHEEKRLSSHSYDHPKLIDKCQVKKDVTFQRLTPQCDHLILLGEYRDFPV